MSKKSVRATALPAKIPYRLFNQSPDIILTVDQKYRIVFMNRAMEGHKPKRMIGRDSALLFPRGFRAWYRRSMDTVLRRGEEIHFQYSTDQSVWWQVRIAPMQRGKRVQEAMILCTDVTERRVLHAQAIRHARLATIGVLAASVAHEINNPNSAILFNSSVISRIWADSQPILDAYFQEHGDFLLGDMNYSEAQQTATTLLEEVVHNTRRVERIVDNLKHLAKRDDLCLKGDSVDVHATLQAAIMILNHKIRRHTHHFEFIPCRTIPTLLGNSPQLEQVFINVILNALQSLPNPEKSVRVWTEFNAKEKIIRVVVRDEGEGISPVHLPRLTEAFFTTRPDADGTGLGLSISNLILKRHGGSLHFDSVEGEGTVVTISLPVRSPSCQPETEKNPGDGPLVDG